MLRMLAGLADWAVLAVNEEEVIPVVRVCRRNAMYIIG